MAYFTRTLYCPFGLDGSHVVCSGEIYGVEKRISGMEKRLMADAKVGFLFSGGPDSSLVCAVTGKRPRSPMRLVTSWWIICAAG